MGAGVTGFRRGDAVYGMAGGVAGLQGSLAEFAAVDARLMALKPANLGMREAAALPLIFITAWRGWWTAPGSRPGQTLLVQGGAGRRHSEWSALSAGISPAAGEIVGDVDLPLDRTAEIGRLSGEVEETPLHPGAHRSNSIRYDFGSRFF